MVNIKRGTSILKIYTDVYVENHGGSTKNPTCVVDRTDTVQNGCRPRITASDRASLFNA